jgi:hypothetical protein
MTCGGVFVVPEPTGCHRYMRLALERQTTQGTSLVPPGREHSATMRFRALRVIHRSSLGRSSNISAKLAMQPSPCEASASSGLSHSANIESISSRAVQFRVETLLRRCANLAFTTSKRVKGASQSGACLRKCALIVSRRHSRSAFTVGNVIGGASGMDWLFAKKKSLTVAIPWGLFCSLMIIPSSI